ncbi:septum site-determining protein MinD [Methanohalophilus levihalophilus]|uniref:tyrosine-protein kinase family protein n=1 Tax=Methanohalophilus levihalophilus TaxID=1431282 RepID=UPI001AE12404|nr:MinD/ParA family protein [Methanohalophilus levihalophilus]MBP2030098.1 septum site-determining protein MinD [Methanohalophilus levihalophilus]
MSICISVHSSKGGTGKTCISQNLASAYAMEGKNVCLMDLDLKSPSLFGNLFPVKNRWLNSVLEGNRDVQDVLVDATDSVGTKGKLSIGYSNPEITAIRDISLKDRHWQSQALKEMVDCKKELFSNGYDVVILDSSPGVDYTSVNVVACSDYVLTVFKSGESRGVQPVIDGIYKPLEKKCGAVENMNVNGVTSFSIDSSVPILAMIPCMCDVSEHGTKKIFTLEDPTHPFSKAIFSVKEQIR